MFPVRCRIVLRYLFLIAIFGMLPAAGQQRPSETSPANPSWKIKFAESGSNPVLSGTVLYVGSADGAVYALNSNSGETKWRFQTGENLSPATSEAAVITAPRGASLAEQMAAGTNAAEKQKTQGIRRVDMTPAVENGTVFFGAGDRLFYAIDALTGQKKWSYSAGAGMVSNNYTSIEKPAPVVKNGTVYFVTEEGLHAIDAETGKRKWLFAPPQEMSPEEANRGMTRSQPQGFVVSDDVIFLTADSRTMGATQWKQSLFAVDVRSGQQKWIAGVDGGDIARPVAASGVVFFTADDKPPSGSILPNRTTLYGIDAANGQIKWKFGAEKKYGTASLVVAAHTAIFCTDRILYALELETGRQLWTFSSDEISGVRADEQQVYVSTHKGSLMRPKDTLHALAITNGQEKWSLAVNGDLALQDGILYAGGDHVRAIAAGTGKELWSFKGSGRESVRLISGNTIFLTSPTVSYVGSKHLDQGFLYAIDAKTGKGKY